MMMEMMIHADDYVRGKLHKNYVMVQRIQLTDKT